jgi:hypothetical protein
MPPITAQYESGLDVMKVRYEQWLESLRRAGFVPIRLSEALSRVESGQGLPERAVVAVFDPGYRRTKEIVDPIFRRRGFPAVWMTDSSAMRRGHREYVTHRDARRMISSGWWDVAYSRRRGGYQLRSLEGRGILGGAGPVWSKTEGTLALNKGSQRQGLNVLTINQDWLGPELVDRLKAELPYESKTCLEKAVIHSRDWGVSGRHTSSAESCAAFDVEAPADRRDNSLHWLGTMGMRELRLTLDVERVVGELRLHLLRDEAAGSQVSVVFNETSLFVDEWQGAQKRRLYTISHGSRVGKVNAVIGLHAGRLAVQANNGPAWISQPLRLSDRGALVLQVLERMRGVARAESIRLTIEPLGAIPMTASGK